MYTIQFETADDLHEKCKKVISVHRDMSAAMTVFLHKKFEETNPGSNLTINTSGSTKSGLIIDLSLIESFKGEFWAKYKELHEILELSLKEIGVTTDNKIP